jgi:hypothetical protein
MDRDEMSNLYRRSSIDASYQVSRKKPSDGKSSHCLWQGELINGMTCSREKYGLQ